MKTLLSMLTLVSMALLSNCTVVEDKHDHPAPTTVSSETTRTTTIPVVPIVPAPTTTTTETTQYR